MKRCMHTSNGFLVDKEISLAFEGAETGRIWDVSPAQVSTNEKKNAAFKFSNPS